MNGEQESSADNDLQDPKMAWGIKMMYCCY